MRLAMIERARLFVSLVGWLIIWGTRMLGIGSAHLHATSSRLAHEDAEPSDKIKRPKFDQSSPESPDHEMETAVNRPLFLIPRMELLRLNLD